MYMFFGPFGDLPTNQPTENQIELHLRLCAAQKYDIVRKFMLLFCNVTRQIRVFYLLPFLKPKCDLRDGQH